MSRHGRKVPTHFFRWFAEDSCRFADTWASGRLISVLEGGYSDRALASGGLAWLCGVAGSDDKSLVDETWWNAENLDKV